MVPMDAGYFRRCNACDEVITNFQENQHCLRCGKFMAPFFYFDDHKLHFTDSELRAYYPIPKDSYGPLIGLSAHWSNWDTGED
jgi:hypothetical protein